MAGKKSKTDVAARREQREKGKKVCPFCGLEQKMALMIQGRGKAKMTRLCCLKANGELA